MVYGEAWIEGTEFAIGDSEHMRKVILDTSKCNSEHEVWHGISRNRSIEWLKLVMGYSEIDLHDDNILGLFIKYNCNLRCISFNEIEMDRPQTFNQLVALLSTCNNRRLECIKVSGIDGTDDQAAMFYVLQCIEQTSTIVRTCSRWYQYWEDRMHSIGEPVDKS